MFWYDMGAAFSSDHFHLDLDAHQDLHFHYSCKQKTPKSAIAMVLNSGHNVAGLCGCYVMDHGCHGVNEIATTKPKKKKKKKKILCILYCNSVITAITVI